MIDRMDFPSLGGATGWLNTEPLGRADLGGHVVLVDFWTLTCINWLRAQPYIRAWSQAYRDDGLIVLGVHTPEFSFEHDSSSCVRRSRSGRSTTRSPPTTTTRSGARSTTTTGRRSTSSTPAASSATTTSARGGTSSPSASSSGCSASTASWSRSVEGSAWRRRRTGSACARPRRISATLRGEHFASPGRAAFDERRAYELPVHLRLNQWALAGEWTVGREHVVVERAGGSVAFRFHARDAHLVLSPGAGAPIPFRVLLDGEAPGASHGVDVDEDGDGVLREGRLYQLVRQPGGVRERTLEITFVEPGAEAYAFTFG